MVAVWPRECQRFGPARAPVVPARRLVEQPAQLDQAREQLVAQKAATKCEAQASLAVEIDGFEKPVCLRPGERVRRGPGPGNRGKPPALRCPDIDLAALREPYFKAALVNLPVMEGTEQHQIVE